jgi:hypothetical protein
MAAPVAGDFHSKVVYKRQLTANDRKERSRLSIRRAPALRICPEAFAPPEGTYISSRDLRFYDAAFNHLPMVFQRRDNKNYLTGRGWREFVKANQLGQGDIVRIHELKHKSGNGERIFMIGLVQLMGALIG